MKRFQTRRRVPYSPKQMYDLVADVKRYPEFLPLCEALRVRSTRAVDGHDVLVADMTMGYSAIRETITSEVTLFPDEPKVVVRYLSGPFSKMENRWEFVTDPQGGCDVQFFIAYELRSSVLGFVVSQVFDKAFRKFAAAFEARARNIYGPPAPQATREADIPGSAAPVT